MKKKKSILSLGGIAQGRKRGRGNEREICKKEGCCEDCCGREKPKRKIGFLSRESRATCKTM
jgi:hypothetical protein